MKKSVVCLVLFISSFIIAYSSTYSWAEGVISIVNYSLKPVGYVDNNKYLQTIYNVELKNNDGAPHNFSVKIVFFDKENNRVKVATTKVDIKANETKKHTAAILLEPDLAKQVASTKGFVEDIQ